MMKNNKLIIYEISARWRIRLYLIAVLIILLSVSIVLITGDGFSSFYSNLFINTAIVFVIIGKILTEYKKAIEKGNVSKFGVSVIIGLFIILIWHIL